MLGNKLHGRVAMNRALQEKQEIRKSLQVAEFSVQESMHRLAAFHRRLDRSVRRGRQRHASQCLSAPYRASAAERRAQLVRSIQQQTRDFLFWGEQRDPNAIPDEGPQLTQEDEDLLKEVADSSPELKQELEAALEAAKRPPAPAPALPPMRRARSLSSPATSAPALASPAAQAPTGATLRTTISSGAISAFLEHLDASARPVEPLGPELRLGGSPQVLRRSNSAGVLEVSRASAGRRQSLFQRRWSQAQPQSQRPSLGNEGGSRPGTGRRSTSRPTTPSCTSPQGSPKSPTVERVLFRQPMSAKEEG